MRPHLPAVVITALLAPAGAPGQTVPTAAAPGPCKPRNVVVLVAGGESRESAEMGRLVESSLGNRPCYKVRDVVDALEAGVGEGLAQFEEARRRSEAGQAEFLAMRLEAARPHLEAAARSFTQGFAYLPYHGPFVEALMYLGATRAGIGDRAGGIDAFVSALRLRPDADVADYSALPEAVEAFDLAKAAAAAGAGGALVVDSVPPGAEVWLDGKVLGQTPLEEPSVAAGPHWVVLRKAGYQRKTVPLTVRPGGSAVVGERDGTLLPARRKPLYDRAIAKLGPPESDEDPAGAIEDVKALFLSDLVAIVRIRGTGDAAQARLSLWDLATMERVWTGREPEAGPGYLGRGAAESLIARAVDADEARRRVQESGAATMTAKSGGIVSKWWFWTVIGAVVAGGVTTAAVLLSRDDARGPEGLPRDGSGAVIVRFRRRGSRAPGRRRGKGRSVCGGAVE